MPHRQSAYRTPCLIPVAQTRTERQTVPNPLQDPFWPDEDEDDYLDLDVEVPVVDEHGRPMVEVCGREAASECRRCRYPLCDRHTPVPARCCELCEREYSREPMPAFVRWGWAGVIASVVGLFAAIGCSVLGRWWWSLGLFIAALLARYATHVVDCRGEALRRRRFLAQETRRPQ